jgi:hypothetical protein
MKISAPPWLNTPCPFTTTIKSFLVFMGRRALLEINFDFSSNKNTAGTYVLRFRYFKGIAYNQNIIGVEEIVKTLSSSNLRASIREEFDYVNNVFMLHIVLGSYSTSYTATSLIGGTTYVSLIQTA